MSIPADKLGSVGQLPDGRFFVRFERHVTHSIETVWKAISDPTALAQWFPEIQLDPQQGGAFSIRFGGDCDGPAHVVGTITEMTPPTMLQFGDMRFELRPVEDGCVIVFTDVLHFERGRTPGDVTDSVLAGWHRFMDILEAHLDERDFDRSAPEPDYSVIEVAGKPTASDNR